MTAFNVVAELPGSDLTEVDDELLDSFADHAAAVGRSLLGRIELVLTLDAADLTAAIAQAQELLLGRDVIALHVLPTDDFDRAGGIVSRPALMSVSEAAEALGYTRTRIQQLIDGNTLPALKVGKTWVVLAAGVDTLREALGDD